MEAFNVITPLNWATLILSAATIFAILWGLDAKTHKALVKVDISDKELQTHRNILVASFLMEATLIGMFWFQALLLPLFIALFITRTVHEFIDELHFHANRCSPYESYLHLGMWVAVLTKTASMFIWGFFYGYEGVLALPFYMYVWAAVVFSVLSFISLAEWKR